MMYSTIVLAGVDSRVGGFVTMNDTQLKIEIDGRRIHGADGGCMCGMWLLGGGIGGRRRSREYREE